MVTHSNTFYTGVRIANYDKYNLKIKYKNNMKQNKVAVIMDDYGLDYDDSYKALNRLNRDELIMYILNNYAKNEKANH